LQNGYFLISVGMFGPAMGINEDPVNGSSGGALQHQINFKLYQGFAVGRKGLVEVEMEFNEQGQPIADRIIGDAVIVFKTTIYV